MLPFQVNEFQQKHLVTTILFQSYQKNAPYCNYEQNKKHFAVDRYSVIIDNWNNYNTDVVLYWRAQKALRL
jgi:hypothetical protein